MTDLAQRYGSRSPLARAGLVALVVLLAAAGLGWLGWAAYSSGTPDVQSELVSFDVVGDHGAQARFTVVRTSTDVEASCLLRATAVDMSVVGELNVPVNTTDDVSTTLTRTVRTERRATSVELIGCTAPGQTRPR